MFSALMLDNEADIENKLKKIKKKQWTLTFLMLDVLKHD